MSRPMSAVSHPPARGGRSLVPVSDVTNAFGTVFAAVSLALVMAYWFVPDIRDWLGAPDGLVVWTTTVTLTGAIGVGSWAYRRSTSDSNFRLLLPLTAGFLLLQNLRFGSDLFGYPLPTITGVEVGSLTDLREVVSIGAERLGLGFTTGLLVMLVMFGLTGAGAAWARRWANDHVLVTEAPVLMWFVAALGCAAAIPTLGFFGEGSGAWFITAMAGLASAGLLVIAGLAAGDHRRTAAGWRRRILPWTPDEGPLTGIPSDQAE